MMRKKYRYKMSSSLPRKTVPIIIFGILHQIFCPNLLEARKFDGLRVHGNYRVLEPIVSEIPRNRSGVSREDILQRVREKLLRSGIKPERPHKSTHFLEVELVIHSKGTNFTIEVALKKMAQSYGYDPSEVGAIIKLPQGRYGLFGNAGRNKSYILEAVDEVMDEFLADYKDSNLK